jgi:two-component system OmpR family response regulator
MVAPNIVGWDDVGIELVAWPQEERRRQALAKAGVPRMLVLGADDEPPGELGLDEDWIRTPVSVTDLRARAERLRRTMAPLHESRPFIDQQRILHRGPAAVALTRTEAVIMDLLLQRHDEIVSIDEIEHAAWRHGAPSRDAVHAAMARLRRRLQAAMLVVRSVRGAGFVLELDRAA